MDAGKRTIFDIFNGSRIFEIPFFQRSYVWDEPQWERLLEDVEEVCQTQRPYFVGSLILKQKPTSMGTRVGDIRTVIDGQQRLTTISILLKVFCLKTNSMKKFDKRFRLDDDDSLVIQHNYNDVDAYNYVMNLTEAVSTERKDNISRAYQYFLENLNPDKLDFQLICDNLHFVGIDLNADEDEQQIFDTINSLGVRLTTAELLKNYFFGREDIDEYILYWRDVFEYDEDTRNYWDQDITTGRIHRTFIDMFFFSFLQIKIQDSKLNVSTEDKQNYSKSDRLFESYKNFIKKYLNDDKQVILTELKHFAEVFRKTFNSEVVEQELSGNPGLERINTLIFALDTATLIPYVLFVECNQDNEEERTLLYEYLESYIMRRLVMGLSTKNYNQLFYESLILKRVLTKKDLADFLNGQEDNINRMPDDNEVEEAFHTSRLTNKYSLGVLYMIETKIRNRQLHSTQLLGIKKYSLEHMMPKKWRNNWPPTETEMDAEARDKVLLTLGNLAMITQTLNTSISDADWETKKNGKGAKGGLLKYAEGIDTLFGALDLPYWNEATISDRADQLAEAALTIWSTK